LKEEAVDPTMWRNRFGRGVRPVVRLLNECLPSILYSRKQ
jgi:hypothetical protein